LRRSLTFCKQPDGIAIVGPILSTNEDLRIYSLNIGVVTPGPLGFLTVWPAGQSMPTVGTLSASAPGIVSDAALVPAGIDGAINVFVADTTDIIIDIDGYFAP
jgi:hypothetical protein